MHPKHIFFFLLLHTTFTNATSRSTCVPTQPLTSTFCISPPVVPSVSLSQYTGTWFQLATSGTAGNVSPPFCTTANYTLTEESSILVQNCNPPPGSSRVLCLAGVATQREGGTTAQLQVSFGAGMPPGPYNIAALLGSSTYGYFAAAVYSCVLRNGVPQDGIFFIARSPFNARNTVQLLLKDLKCKGFQTPSRLVFTKQGDGCEYFFGENGFEQARIEDFMLGSSQMM